MFPVLLNFGPIKIFTYGFVPGPGLFERHLRGRPGSPALGLPRPIYDLCFYTVLGALVGSRLLYVILEIAGLMPTP